MARRGPLRLQGSRIPALLLAALCGWLLSSDVNFVPSPGSSATQLSGRRQALLGLGLAAPAAAASSAWAVEWAGSYEDPERPGCKRKVLQLDTNEIQVNGKDPDRGRTCNANKNLEKWTVKGTVSGNDVRINLGGPDGGRQVVGKWDGSGITFENGMKWEKKAGPPAPAKKQKGVVNSAMGGVAFEQEDRQVIPR
eukprot:gb/GFBE01033090.1/.p1 GENE.gb/GFBE01033090.1/~~gb/GFBE01033090.1/.p1  ORF type:complete len:195 (+),score=29.24 gb/GFBE01033090.1/:1-585(+)